MTEQKKWLEQEIKDYTELKDDIGSKQKAIIASAKKEAENLILEANKTIERTIREIKEARANKEKTNAARKRLQSHRDGLKHEEAGPNATPKVNKIPSAGDRVRLPGQDSVGEVLQIKGRKAEVLIGAIKSLVDLNKLEVVGNREESKSYNRSVIKGINYQKRAADFSPSLDLRGKRAEEAVSLLDPFLDEGLLLGMVELKVIHGKGDGVLRRVVREYLKGYDYIQSIRDEHVDHGGAGVSVITLK